jgi:glycosyltransferase involved in cell wall biosynthesis
MRVVAIIAVRNESRYIERCCRHLVEQGIEFAVIDNDSTDDTREIVGRFAGHGLVHLETRAYDGFYDWTALLKRKEELSRQLDADWFMHLDADEIPESPVRGEPLVERLRQVDAEGCSAVNFDEFVFVPTSAAENHEGTDYVAGMRRYFFFEPYPRRLVRLWKKAADIDLSRSGGHDASFAGRRLYPINFVLRHYIALCELHLRSKYNSDRTYSPAEVAAGWHGWRARINDVVLRLPDEAELADTSTDGGWDRSRPAKRHLFIR